MEYFYNYKVSAWQHDNNAFDEHGVSVDKWTLRGSYKCDLQPVNEKQVNMSFGYSIEADYVIYTDSEILESDMIIYNNETYKVVKKIHWENNAGCFSDYCETYIKKYDFKIKEDTLNTMLSEWGVKE